MNFDFALDIGRRAYELGELRVQLAIKCHAALALGKAHVVGEKFEEARNIASGSNDWETIAKIEKEFVNLYLVQGKVGEAEKVERRLKSLQDIIE